MHILVKSLCSLALLLPSLASAENSTHTGGYTIHHNAITTDSLPAQVASSYGIQRSKSRALLNVSVIHDELGTMGKPVRAEIRAVAKTSPFGAVPSRIMSRVAGAMVTKPSAVAVRDVTALSDTSTIWASPAWLK